MSDQSVPRLDTLLDKQDLQEILHGWGSTTYHMSIPRSSYQPGQSSRYVIHAFTGRVPSPAEIYYRTYINKKGDLRTDAASGLAEAYLGWVSIRTNRYANDHQYRADDDAYISGRILPEEADIRVTHGYYIRNFARSHNDISMMMDVTFSATPTKYWGGSAQKSVLESLEQQGLLAGPLKPTWFFISESTAFPIMETESVYNTQNEQVAVINVTTATDDSKRRGLIFGRFGAIGSGAEIELSQGYDHVNSVRMTSIKIKSN